MNKPSQESGYALFDLDQTLIPWDTQLLFCDFVLKRMPMRRLYLLGLVPLLPFYKLLGSDGMKRVFLNYLFGMTKDDIESIAQEFVDHHYPSTFYQEICDRIAQQKSLGRVTVLSSASPEFWVRPIAEKLGFDHWFGTEVEASPRVPLFPDLPSGNNKGFNKLRRMKGVLPPGFDLNNGTLSNSCGFSDSHADLPMLMICEQAVMVHPTDKLQQHGAAQNWETEMPKRPTANKKQFVVACFKQALGLWK